MAYVHTDDCTYVEFNGLRFEISHSVRLAVPSETLILAGRARGVDRGLRRSVCSDRPSPNPPRGVCALEMRLGRADPPSPCGRTITFPGRLSVG